MNGLTLLTHEQVHILNHIQEELISSVLDSLTSPADLPRYL